MIVDPAASQPMISVIAFGPDAIEENRDTSLQSIGERQESLPVLWIDIVGLGDVSILQECGKKFGLHNLALEDVINVHQRPKVEEYDDHLFIVCRMPRKTHVTRSEQVSLFLGKGFVISFHEHAGDCFEPVRHRLRASRGRIRKQAADYLAYALLDAVTDSYFPIIEDLSERIYALEEAIMSEPVSDDVKRIHALKRELLTTRRAVWPQRDMLNQLIRDESPHIGQGTKIYLRDCFDHTFQLIDLVETYRETISDLTDIFMSAQNTRMNEVMKVLTVIATIFMPLTLVSSIYGMNFDRTASPWNMPELGWAFGYPVAMVSMLVIAAGMLFYFRRKKWIGGKRRRALRRAKKQI